MLIQFKIFDKKNNFIFFLIFFITGNLNLFPAYGFDYFSLKSRKIRACTAEGLQQLKETKDQLNKKLFTKDDLKNICTCYYNKVDIGTSNIEEKVKKKYFHQCQREEVLNYVYGGKLFLNKIFFESKYPRRGSNENYNVIINSVQQLKIRGEYGRYITFIGTTENSYSGKTFSAKPGYIDCEWGGSGSSSYNKNSGSGSWSTDGYCYGKEGTPERVIPDGIEVRRFRYELDCVDGTFDRKGDKADYADNSRKGWMGVMKDPTAFMAAKNYCPFIENLPK